MYNVEMFGEFQYLRNVEFRGLGSRVSWRCKVLRPWVQELRGWFWGH